MSDDIPSISGLQRWHRSLQLEYFSPSTEAHATAVLIDAVPTLLEIAAAALALGPDLVYMVGPLSERLRDALAKVRP